LTREKGLSRYAAILHFFFFFFGRFLRVLCRNLGGNLKKFAKFCRFFLIQYIIQYNTIQYNTIQYNTTWYFKYIGFWGVKFFFFGWCNIIFWGFCVEIWAKIRKSCEILPFFLIQYIIQYNTIQYNTIWFFKYFKYIGFWGLNFFFFLADAVLFFEGFVSKFGRKFEKVAKFCRFFDTIYITIQYNTIQYNTICFFEYFNYIGFWGFKKFFFLADAILFFEGFVSKFGRKFENVEKFCRFFWYNI